MRTHIQVKMGRQSRQKRHLKQLSASAKHAALVDGDNSLEEVLESSSDDDEVLWSDEELDNQPNDAFKKLFHGSQHLQTAKRPFRYNGNSLRTRKRRKAQAKKQAAKNGQTLLDFFSSVPNDVSSPSCSLSDDTCETVSDPDETVDLSLGEQSTSHDSLPAAQSDELTTEYESESSGDEGPSNDELICNIEEQLRSKTLQQSQRWRMAAILQYLRLLKFEKSRTQASLCVARQLGGNIYLSRRIRSWTFALKNGQEVPVSMRGKHIKVKSLLDDEDVRNEIIEYLRFSKFEFYTVDFVRYVSDVIFPKLGINRATPIG